MGSDLVVCRRCGERVEVWPGETLDDVRAAGGCLCEDAPPGPAGELVIVHERTS